ncbi:MAG TPA: hypothetical protein VFD43_05915 [Planctomycetota bacterium]|nr:hypothetical protein [Planctomycetota bacterium]
MSTGVSRVARAYPLLFAAYPGAFFFSQNLGEFKLSQAIVPTLLVFAAVVVVWGTLHTAFGHPAKARLLASISVTMFFSYGPVQLRSGPGWSEVVSMAWIVGFAATAILVARAPSSLRAADLVAATIGAILMIMVTSTIAWRGVIGFVRVELRSDGEVVPATTVGGEVLAPDIYFIVVDAYGRADTLEAYYDYDNREFLDFLSGRGFLVADEATSNYSATAFSLGSCLNLSYLKEVGRLGIDPLFDGHQLAALIDDSRAERFLRSQGYKVIAFQSGVSFTEMTGSDVYVRTGRPTDDFANGLLNMTPIPEFISRQSDANPFNIHRDRIEYLLDHIPDAAALAQAPRFVFAHIPAPHPPFVFGPHGEHRFPNERYSLSDGARLVHDEGLGYDGYVLAYRDQLLFLNSRLRGMLDAILSGSERPPVIVLVGDHGPRPRVRLDDPGQDIDPEVYNVLCALYLPEWGGDESLAAISLVDLFRVIFDRYLGTDLGRLVQPDASEAAARSDEVLNGSSRPLEHMR